MDARCWVQTDARGGDWHEDRVAHFDTEAEAREDMARMRTNDDYEPGYGPEDVRQLDGPCLIVNCVRCGEEFEGDEFTHVHWPDASTADAVSDGEWWRDDDGAFYCPSEARPDA